MWYRFDGHPHRILEKAVSNINTTLFYTHVITLSVILSYTLVVNIAEIYVLPGNSSPYLNSICKHKQVHLNFNCINVSKSF